MPATPSLLHEKAFEWFSKSPGGREDDGSFAKAFPGRGIGWSMDQNNAFAPDEPHQKKRHEQARRQHSRPRPKQTGASHN